MPRPWRIRYCGAKYHVTSRGNGRQRIFLERSDHERFLEQLESALEKDEVILYAYVLMPNHYHLFVETPHGNIQRFMQRLNTAYSMYFRYKHSRPGHCLQGRYSAKLVGGDEYIVRITRYIHLNPVKTRNMKSRSFVEKRTYLSRYDWSSYLGYVNHAMKSDMVNYHWLKMMGCKTERGNRVAYKRYVEDMMMSDDETLGNALEVSRYTIGDEKFVEEAENDLREMRLEKAVYGDITLPGLVSIDPGKIDEAVAKEFTVNVGDLHYHGQRAGIAKSVAVELCCVLAGMNQREAGKYYGYRSDGGVAGQRRALRQRMSHDKPLARCVHRLKRRLARERIKDKKQV